MNEVSKNNHTTGLLQRSDESSDHSREVVFPQNGVSIGFLIYFRDVICGGVDSIGSCTTDEICAEFVKPLTASQQCSYCDLLESADGPPPGEPWVAQANIFLSHCWRYRFVDVLDCLLDRFTDNLPFEWWSNTFMSAVSRIGRTAIILSPWHYPVALTRAWCCWELFCSVQTRAQVEILVGRADVLAFGRALIEDFDAINQMIATVDIRHSEATNPTDKIRIFEAVQSRPEGFDGVNTVIFEHLRKWLCYTALQLLRKIKMSFLAPDLPVPSDADNAQRSEAGNQRTAAVVRPRRRSIVIEQGEYTCEALIRFMCNTGRILNSSGRLEEAREVLEAAAASGSANLGPDHRLTLLCKAYHGNAVLDLGSYSEAESLLSSVLDMQISLFGELDNDTLITFEQLATAKWKCDKLKEAEVLILKAVNGARDMYGNEHDVTQTFGTTLGSVLSAQGRNPEALEVRRTALRFLAEVHGNSHPKMLTLRNDVAVNLSKLGHLEESAVMFEELLRDKIAKYGSDHPSTLTSAGNLSGVYRRLDRLDLAERLTRDVLESKTRVLGGRHPSTMIAMSNLSGILKERRNFKEAEEILRHLIIVSAEVQGDRHTLTLTCKSNLALVLFELGSREQVESAISMLREVLAIRRAQDGESHPITLFILFQLAVVLSAYESKDEALALLDDCWEKRRLVLGEQHIDTVVTRDAAAALRGLLAPAFPLDPRSIESSG